MSRKKSLDNYDYAILEILQQEGAITNKELARRIGLSPPATLVRTNHLKASKHLLDSRYQVNWRLLGYHYHVTVYCVVDSSKKEAFLKLLNAYSRVREHYQLECESLFGIDLKQAHYVLLGVFKSKEEWKSSWKSCILSKDVVLDFKVFSVLEKRQSVLPVPLNRV